MPRYKAPSIDSYGGIKPFLKVTKAKHNGYTYADLERNWNWGVGKHINISNLAIMFGVSWPTMDGWIDRMHLERSIPRPDKEVVASNDTSRNTD